MAAHGRVRAGVEVGVGKVLGKENAVPCWRQVGLITAARHERRWKGPVMTGLLPRATNHSPTSRADGATYRAGGDEYLLTREVAALLRTSESTLRYWRYIGVGPASFKVGRRVLYRREAVVTWVRDCEAATASTSPVGGARRRDEKGSEQVTPRGGSSGVITASSRNSY